MVEGWEDSIDQTLAWQKFFDLHETEVDAPYMSIDQEALEDVTHERRSTE